MRNNLLLSAAFLVTIVDLSYAQNCDINATANPSTITCGQSATLSAFGSSTGQVVLNENFNSGGFGAGWGSTPGATSFGNPCSPGGVDGTTHAWMDNNTSVPRTLTSAPYNLTSATAGVSICFDLLFAEQGNNAPCEGPDEPDEGVFLQYSTDGGATWIDIHYFDPNGGNDPQLTNWNNWCFALPVGAITSNTLIRWYQSADSGADYDHWGIDNVQIFQNDINAEVEWLHDGYSYGVGSAGGVNPNAVSPTSTTTYTAQITTGTGSVCTATVTVIVVDPVYDVNVSATPTTICSGDCSTITGDAQIVLDPGGIETYENNEFELVASGSASVNVNVQGINTNSIYSGLIDNVTINGFSFSGTSLCTNFGGCPCGTTTVSFGQQCNLTANSFTVTLTSPGGCTIILAPSGVANGNYTDVVFVPVGGSAFNGTFPSAGPWNPQQPFSNFNGCDPNGVWELSFDAPGLGLGIGTLNGWSITFNDPPIYAPVDIAWSPTTGLSNPTSINTDACPNSSTDYVLTVSSGTPGCAVHTETVSIIVDPCGGCIAPDVNITPLTACSPATVNLSTAIAAGSDPATLTYHATQADAQNDVSPIATTVGASNSYWVRAEDPADHTCFNVYEIVVTINTLDDASFTLTDYCAGAANAATGIATPGGTFSFNPAPGGGVTINATTGAISNGVSGATYTVQYTTAGACSSSSTETVTVSGLSYTVVIVDENCGAADGEINLTAVGGSPVFSYSIDGGVSTQGGASFTGLSAGAYSILITDGNGCEATGNESVASIGGPTIDNISVSNETCPGSCDGFIIVTVSGGFPPYSYQWYDDAGNPIGTNADAISNLCAGNYSVEVSDVGSACASTDFATLTPPAVADPSFILTDFCSDAANAATITGTTGGTFAFNPNPLDGSTINPTTGEITGAVGGTTYSVEYTTAGACPESSIETVEAQICCNIILDTTSTVAPNCGLANGEINVDAVGGDGNYTFSLDGGAFNASNSFTGLSAGTYQIEVQDGVGACTSIIDVTLNDLGAPTITNVIINNPLCVATNGIDVIATGGTGLLDYELINGAFTVSNSTGDFTGLPAGNYTINVTDANGCIATSNGVINPVIPIQPVISEIITDGCSDVCDGQITVTSNTGVNYTLNGSSNGSGVFSNLCQGNYVITVTDANGCTATITALVPTIPQTTADFTHLPSTITIFDNVVNFYNQSVSADQYVWQITGSDGYNVVYNTENVSHEFPSDTGEYVICLTAINTFGCQDQQCITLVVEDDIVIFVPNTFTPDGDEYNQTFRAYVNGVDVYDFDFLIFNRWGELIWENHNPEIGWDGTYNGKLVQEGAYVWKIVVKDIEFDYRKTYTGHVTILK